ncbi:MAG: PAS domain S-box protein, partial [Ignavibacteria bacterium]|nr:PAS domain S-box protein [Ignavibacteria bacterium]
MSEFNSSQLKINFLPEILCLLENTGYGICLIDTSQRILWANKVIKRWYPNKNLADSYLHQIFNFTEHTSLDFLIEELTKKEVLIFEEYDNESDNWYLFSAVLVSSDDEKRILLIIEEITEKKSLLEQYVSQLEILDNVEDGIYYVNFQNEILYWNKGAEKIYGYSAEEVLGHTVNVDLKLYDEIDVETLIQMTKELEIYHHYYFQREEYTKNEQKIWIEGSVAMIYSLDKKPQGLLFIVRDITSRKNAEEEIILNDQLKSSLNEISLLLLNDVEEDKIINEILQKCKMLIKCDLCFIITPGKQEQDINELYFETNTSDEDKKKVLRLKENIKSIFHWIALNDANYHQDAKMDNELGLSFIKELGLQEFVVYPSKLKQEIVGLFFIGNKNSSLHKKVNDILSTFTNSYASVVDYIREKKFRELLEEKLNQTQKLETATAIISGIVHDFNNIL